MNPFKNKVGIITGASSGIGRAAAMQFAAQGAQVVLAARRETAGEAVAQEIRAAGGNAVFVRTDVAQEADLKNLIAQTIQTFGRLDFAFNNAGIEGRFAPITELTAADFADTINVNVD